MRLLTRLVPGLVLLCSMLAFPRPRRPTTSNKPIRWIVPYPPGAPRTCWRA